MKRLYDISVTLDGGFIFRDIEAVSEDGAIEVLARRLREMAICESDYIGGFFVERVQPE